MATKAAMKLPDALIARYFRQGELEQVTKVTVRRDNRIAVELKILGKVRKDLWQDLGGGLGLVPDVL